MNKYTYSEEVAGTSYLRHVEVKKNAQGTRVTEMHWLTDTVSGITVSKELKQFKTENGRTRQLRHQKWVPENGKWVQEKITLPKSY